MIPKEVHTLEEEKEKKQAQEFHGVKWVGKQSIWADEPTSHKNVYDHQGNTSTPGSYPTQNPESLILHAKGVKRHRKHPRRRHPRKKRSTHSSSSAHTVTVTVTKEVVVTEVAKPMPTLKEESPIKSPSLPMPSRGDEDVMRLFQEDQAILANASIPIHAPSRHSSLAEFDAPVKIPPITSNRSFWSSPSFPGSSSSRSSQSSSFSSPTQCLTKAWNITKDAYGQKNRQWAPDPVNPGERTLQITYPSGSSNPGGHVVGGTGMYAQPLVLAPNQPTWMQYQVYFDPKFDFVKGGKLPGLFGGHPSCSGGNSAEDCFSAR